ncbi:hypothetical protein CFC21_038524, partial [Triticum aestivum]
GERGQDGSGRRRRGAADHLRDRRRRLHRLAPLREAHGRDPARRPRRRRLLRQDPPPRRPAPAPPRRTHLLPPPQHQERLPPRGPHQDGRSDDKPGGDLHASGLQHAAARHHLQQLHRRAPGGQVLLGEQQASDPLLHVRGLRQDHRQLPPQGPPPQEPEFYVLTEDESPCIFGPIVKQRWSYACAKQLIERLVFAEGAENGLEFTIVRPFNWIGPRMDFIPGVDGPSEGVPRVLACFSNNLLRREPLKLVDGGESQRTFVYIKDAIEAVLLMIENPARANGHIFNVGNPDNEVTVRELAEMMTEVYAKVSGEPPLEEPVIDVSAKEFYGEGYDDSDKRIPDMTLINKQLGWNPKTPLKDLLETTLTYQHKTYKEAVKTQMCLATATPSS